MYKTTHPLYRSNLSAKKGMLGARSLAEFLILEEYETAAKEVLAYEYKVERSPNAYRNKPTMPASQRAKRDRQKRRLRMSVDPEYAAKHRAQVNLRDKKKRDNWSPQHREHRRKLERDRYHAIHKHNPRWKAEHNLRVRLKKFIVGHKSLTMRTLLGCTKDGLVRHLEKHFQRGMTWQNYGTKWHIDHVQPCASFDLTNVEDQKRCFHFSNLRPLWATENWSKGARIVTHQPELLLCNS